MDMIKKANELTFGFVIQADLESLTTTCLSTELTSEADALAVFYGRVIIDFLRGDLEALQSAVSSIDAEFAASPEKPFLTMACRLRIQIRSRVIEPEIIAESISLIEKNSFEAAKWSGEIAMLIATAHTLNNDFDKALAMFQLAARALTAEGFLRKSLRAQMNMLVCESHLFPSKNLFARYYDLFRQATKPDRRETIVATTCLLNISREYQRAGANLAALKYCNRALTLFERQMGELNYYLTLVHRARLLIDLGRMVEARMDIESAQMASFTEVQEQIQDLLPRLEAQATTAAKEMSGPTLSVLEEKLISLLSRGPRERIEIVDEIYGDRLDHETKQNRFKSLIGTFRKKHPDLIIFESGRYRLADQILIPMKPRVS